MIADLLFKNNRDKFLGDNKNFIHSAIEKVLGKKPLSDKDEKFKIAEDAFNESCDTYEESDGNFFCYAEAFIKNSIIGFCRKSKGKYNFVFYEEETTESAPQDKYKSDQFQIHSENSRRAEEIELLNNELSIFDYSIKSITNSCPQSIDSRNILLNAAMICSADNDMISCIYEKRHLPIKEIADLACVSKRLITKYEGYLILLIILFSSDEYLYIKSYLNIKAEEKDGQERISIEG